MKSNIAFSSDNQFDEPVIWTVDDTTLFKYEDIPGGSSSQSYDWYIKDGKPIEIPHTGMLLTYTSVTVNLPQ